MKNGHILVSLEDEFHSKLQKPDLFSVGMRADCIVPEDQCLKKRIAKNKSNIENSPVSLSPPVQNFENTNSNGSTSVCEGSKTHVQALKPQPLKPEEVELINRLVYFQMEYEFPKEEDLKTVYQGAFYQLFVQLSSTTSFELISGNMMCH